MEREVGGGIGMGNTCKPMAVSFQCMTKFTTNKKKERKKINKYNIALRRAISGQFSLRVYGHDRIGRVRKCSFRVMFLSYLSPKMAEKSGSLKNGAKQVTHIYCFPVSRLQIIIK